MDIYKILETFDRLNELDQWAPVTTYVRLADGSYVQADYRVSGNILGGGHPENDSASFVEFSPVDPQTAQKLGLDQALKNKSTTIAPGGDIQGGTPFSPRRVNVTDFAHPDENLPNSIRSKLAQWIKNPTQEGSMADAEHNDTGPKFTGYWKGTDVGTPGQHMVGGAAESIEKRLREKWRRHLDEFGANQPAGTAATQTSNPGTTADQAKIAKDASAIAQSLNKAKSKGVLPPTVSTTQGAQAVMTNPADINKANAQQKREMGAAAASFNDFIKTASTTPSGQSALNTVLTTMQKVKSGT